MADNNEPSFVVGQKVILGSVQTLKILEVAENGSGGWTYKLKTKNGKQFFINLGGSEYQHWFDESELSAA